MNWRKLDLNLLVVFDAVAQTRSVTAAAARLNMSQPAVSHALTRLRAMLQDDLFIRQSNGMEPTPYAVGLAQRVRTALDVLGPSLQTATAFDPAVSKRTFLVAVDNGAALALAAPIAAMAAAAAPNVTLDIRPSGTLEVAELLERGELDLALGGHTIAGGRLADKTLVEFGYAALVRCGHPAAGDGRLSIADLGAYPHLVLSSTGERTDFVDTAMAKTGYRRRVTCNAPLLAASAVLLESNMIAVMGELGAREFARSAPLSVLRLPFETPRLRAAMLWHQRQAAVPAHRWLRELAWRATRAL